MPNINLRLTEQEHAELTEWARDGKRSLQKEIIWRLFTIEGNQAPKVGPATNEPRVQATVFADSQPRDVPSRTVETSHVTADQEWLMRRAGKRK